LLFFNHWYLYLIVAFFAEPVTFAVNFGLTVSALPTLTVPAIFGMGDVTLNAGLTCCVGVGEGDGLVVLDVVVGGGVVADVDGGQVAG
jgi:hypothetical protein